MITFSRPLFWKWGVGSSLIVLSISLWLVTFIAVDGQNAVLFVGIPVVLMGSIIGVWRPRVAFFFFLALLPFIDFIKRIQLAFTEPSRLEWNLVLALPDILLLSAATGVVLRRMIQKRLTITLARPDWWLLAFWASMLLSIVYSRLPLTVGLAAFKLSGLYILVYFLAPELIIKKSHLRALLKMTFILSVIVALYGLRQQIIGMTSFEQKWLTGGYTGLSRETIIYFAFRPFSTLSGPQAYSFYLAIGLFFGVLYLRVFAPQRKMSVEYIGILLIVLALVLSLTRSAILFSFLSWILAKGFISTRFKHPERVVLLAAIFIVLTVLALLKWGTAIQFLALNSGIPFVQRALTVGTLGDRLRGWQGVITNHAYWTPLGYGLGITSFTLMRKYNFSFDLFSHDEYTNILLEQGIIGIFVYAGFIILWIRIVHRRLFALRSPSRRLIGWSLFALCVGILIIDFLGSSLKVSPINVYFWLIAGLLIRSAYFFPQGNSNRSRRI